MKWIIWYCTTGHFFIVMGIFSDLITSVDFWALMGNNPKEFRQI